MLARTCIRCATRRTRLSRPRIAARPQSQGRSYSSAGTGAGAGASSSSTAAAHAQGINGAGALAPFVSELDRIAPSFDIRGDQIQIIQTPSEFYETLKVCEDCLLSPGARKLIIGLGSHSKGQASHIPVNSIHRQDGTRASRHASRFFTPEPRTQAQHSHRRPSRYSRGSRSVMRLAPSALGEGVWSSSSRSAHVSYSESDRATKEDGPDENQ